MTRQVGPTSAADDCVASEAVTVEDGTATVQFTVADGCEVALTLASHEKPDGTFSRDDAQPLHDSNTSTFGPGTHTLSVDLPTEDAETASMANAGTSLTSMLRYAWLGFPAAVAVLTVRRRDERNPDGP